MKPNLKIDLDDLEWNINDNTKKMYSGQMVLNHLEGKLVDTDSLSIYYGSLKGSAILTKNTSAFDNLKSIGYDLKRNDMLRQHITRLYSEKYSYLNHLEVEYDQRFQMHHLYHQVNSKIINPESEQYAKPLEYKSLVKDNQFKETIRQNIGGKGVIINYQKDLKNSIIELMKSIGKEIATGS